VSLSTSRNGTTESESSSDGESVETNVNGAQEDAEHFGLDLDSSVQVEVSQRPSPDFEEDGRQSRTDQVDAGDESGSEAEVGTVWPISITIPGLRRSLTCSKPLSGESPPSHDCDEEDPQSHFYSAVEHAEFV